MEIPKSPEQLIGQMQINSKLAAFMFSLYQQERQKRNKPVNIKVNFKGGVQW